MSARTRKRPPAEKKLVVAAMPAPGPVDCPCGRKCVWAYDDRFINDPREIAAMIDAEPRPDGTCILYYEITPKGEPKGKPWVRELDPKAEWNGPRWRRHICGEAAGGAA